MSVADDDVREGIETTNRVLRMAGTFHQVIDRAVPQDADGREVVAAVLLLAFLLTKCVNLMNGVTGVSDDRIKHDLSMAMATLPEAFTERVEVMLKQ